MNAVLENRWDNVDIPIKREFVAYSDQADSLHVKLLEQFKRDFRHAIEGKRERNNMGRRAYKHYRSHLNPSTHSKNFPSQVYDPYWFSAVNTSAARQMASLFGSGPFLVYKPRGRSDAAQARKYTLSFDYHWNRRRQRPRAKVYDILTQLRLFGTAYAVVYWLEEFSDCIDWVEKPAEIPGLDENDPEATLSVPVRKLESVRKRTTNSPMFDVLHFLECFPDWEAPTVEEGRYFIHAKLRSRQYVLEQMEKGAWSEECVKLALDDPALPETSDQDRISQWQSEVGVQSTLGDTDASGRMFEVAEYITDKYTLTVINRRYIVALQHGHVMGCKPILHVKQHQLPGEHFGMSSFEVVEKMIIHLCQMRNCSAAEAIFSVFQPLLVKSASHQYKDLYQYTPGAKWPVQSPDDVSVLQRGTGGIQVAEQQNAQARSVIDDALATSDAYRGALPGREQKATAITTSVQGAGIRLQLETDLFEESFTIPLGDMFACLMRLMQDEKLTLHITEEQGDTEEVYPDDLYDAELDVIPSAGSSQLKELETKRLLEYLQMCLNYPEAMQQLDIREALKVVAEKVIPKDAARIFKTAEQIQAEQQHAMMMQQMQALQQQQGPTMNPNVAPNGRGSPPVSNRMSSKAPDGGTEELAKMQGEAMAL